jgi:ribonucleotide reductase alpha subunit
MGLAEAMMLFHVKYDSLCGERFAAASMSAVALACWESSFSLAKNGWSTPKAWDVERMVNIFARRLENAVAHDLPESHLRRWSAIVESAERGERAAHTCVTSVAPTGTIASIAAWLMSRAASAAKSVTSGVEPPFAWHTGRQDNSGSDVLLHDLWGTEEHRNKPWMRTASQVRPEWHVTMQAAVCAFCCMSVSKTVNLPNNATLDDVREGYELAWKLGVPGTALYRDGSKPVQVLTALECPSGECSVEKLDGTSVTSSLVAQTSMDAK